MSQPASMQDIFEDNYIKCDYYIDDYNGHDYSFKAGKQPIGSFANECIETARRLGSKYPESRFSILFSGGLDSQITALSFLKAGVPFDLYFISFSNNQNKHEWLNCKDFVKKNNTNIFEVPFDIESFLTGPDIEELIKISECPTPTLLHQLHVLNSLPGIPVLGCGDPIFEKDTHGNWNYIESEIYFRWHRYIYKTQKKAVPSFLNHSNRQLMSLMKDVYLKDFFVEKKINHFDFQIKYEFYKLHFNEITNSGPLYTGYENFIDLIEPFLRKYESLYAPYRTRKFLVSDLRQMILTSHDGYHAP